jgi:hypothetical protein
MECGLEWVNLDASPAVGDAGLNILRLEFSEAFESSAESAAEQS